jgi:hypothetical protein
LLIVQLDLKGEEPHHNEEAGDQEHGGIYQSATYKDRSLKAPKVSEKERAEYTD